MIEVSGMDMGGIKSNAKIIGIAVGVVFGFIFILQNFEQTSFQFLIWTLFSAPKWIVVSGTFAIGLAFGFLLGKKKS
ncbi:MAG TPA: LapA family protein [Deltaproteobacteria bacterium]|nr:LapA family protein [Deltaproteobacteria bacterium]HXK46371.1 LapA family protein [Deltaproteobacteria bacterium]